MFLNEKVLYATEAAEDIKVDDFEGTSGDAGGEVIS